MRTGTVAARRPRVRDLEQRSKSWLLPLSTRRTSEVSDLLPDLYLPGLASAVSPEKETGGRSTASGSSVRSRTRSNTCGWAACT